jgi:hypothetical protein
MRSSRKRVLAVAVATGIGLPAWGLAGPASAADDTEAPAISALTLTPPSIVQGSTPVALSAKADDKNHGGSKIKSATYTIDAGSAQAMTAAGGGFNNQTETVSASLATAGLAIGDHDVCVTATDKADNSGTACTTLTVKAPGGDSVAPIVDTINFDPSVPIGDPAVITARADDSTTGNSNIKKAEYQLDFAGPWVAMSAADGALDEVTENLTVSIPTASLSIGRHDVCIRATDVANNVSAGTGDDCFHFAVNNSGGRDTDAPTVTINQAIGQDDPTNVSPILFTVEFNEDVTGFDDDDVMLSGTAGATDANVSGSGHTYTVSVSGMTGSGTVVAAVKANAAADLAGNLSEASTSTDNEVTYDITAPTVTINQAIGQADPTDASPINFTVVFDEPVTGFGDDDVVLSGTAGATTAVVTGSGDTYNVAVSGMTGSGTVIADIKAAAAKDDAKNDSEASTSTDNEVTYNAPDVTAPTVTIDQAAGQADPTSDLPIRFSVVFSEPVTGFDDPATDLVVNAPAGAVATIGDAGDADATTYTVTISGLTADGDVVVTVPAGAAQDAAANASEASTSTDNTVTYDDLDELTVVASRHEVNQGESVTMTATMVDAGGNTVDVTDETVFTSDVASDVIVGDQVTFPHASPHTITGTYVGGDTDSDLVEVNPRDVGPVDRPNDGNNGSEGTPSNGGTGNGGTGSDEDGEVAGEFLPGTGAGTNPIALGLAGLGILGAGVAVTRVTRRRSVRIL